VVEATPRPSDYIEAQMAIYLVVACIVILHFPRRMGVGGFKLAVASAAYKVATSFGVEEDATATVALLLAVPALFRLYQFVITLLATFPLQLTFPFVVDLIPRFAITAENFFKADGATPEVAARRKASLEGLQKGWGVKFEKCLDFGKELKTLISDVRFTSGRCFPPFNQVVNEYLDPSMALAKTNGPEVIDIDGNKALDISGSYGVNVCGYEAYKGFMAEGWKSAKDKGLYLGSLDETTRDNIKMIKAVSGLEEISFHMSGTEAVMAAVRCARFNQRKSLCVVFGGAYHGWWDGMQPSAGNERTPQDVLQLKDMNRLALTVIASRASEIAAVMINPLQCFHLNSSPPSDLVLQTNNRKVGANPGYKAWLQELRQVCTDAGVLLIFDEVYTGFRVAPGGAQQVYDVKADMVCYGKTLGGGLPVGVLCGKKDSMTRADPKKAARVAYVIGTFAGHPAVMGSMNAFLTWLNKETTAKEYDNMHTLIDAFIAKSNKAFKAQGFPLEFANWFSVWSMVYTEPGRYHWMFQYFLRDAGVALSWVGTGRCLFSLDWTQADYDKLLERILVACAAMKAGGWWEPPRVSVKKSIGLEFAAAIFKSLVGFA